MVRLSPGTIISAIIMPMTSSARCSGLFRVWNSPASVRTKGSALDNSRKPGIQFLIKTIGNAVHVWFWHECRFGKITLTLWRFFGENMAMVSTFTTHFTCCCQRETLHRCFFGFWFRHTAIPVLNRGREFRKILWKNKKSDLVFEMLGLILSQQCYLLISHK